MAFFTTSACGGEVYLIRRRRLLEILDGFRRSSRIPRMAGFYIENPPGRINQTAQKPKKSTLAWAALIRLVYEVDPLKCPRCGGDMDIIGFIEKEETIKNILISAGLWEDTPARPPPISQVA